MSKLHGFRRGDETISITHLPRYKKPVLLIGKGLLIGNGLCCQTIASLDSEEYAEGFCKMLERWLGIDKTESEGEQDG